jgi:hypothetical protein
MKNKIIKIRYIRRENCQKWLKSNVWILANIFEKTFQKSATRIYSTDGDFET